MKICLFCFSDAGARLAEQLCRLLQVESACVHTIDKFARPYGFTAHTHISADMDGLFAANEALIFIGACGVAVRLISPHLQSKTVDPAVLVIDDKGRFVISLLSGHIGGANALAEKVAAKIGAIPVVTTATDGAGRFSCDVWAAAHGFAISSMQTAKEISAAVLTRDIPVCAEAELPAALPNGLVRGEGGEIGIYIGVGVRSPFTVTLRLIPRVLTLGIGCRRGVTAAHLHAVVENVLAENLLDIRAVAKIATIDVKKDEAGLAEFANDLDADLVFYTAKELEAVDGDFAESAFVRKTVGVGNVCERAAALAGGKIIVKKSAQDGVTVAVSVCEWGIGF